MDSSLAGITEDAWQALGRRRVFFGHQSVGAQLMDGVRALAQEGRVPALEVVETADPARMTRPGLYHARVGANGAPATKLEAFRAVVARGVSEGGIALLKYCYVDVTARSDPSAIFDEYQRTATALQAAHRALTLVHVTMPLQADYGEWAHWKRVIRGKYTTYRELNLVRHRYNEALRARYAGREPLFDLAALEAVDADGRAASARFRRQRVPVLSRSWNSDDGHLNDVGRRRIAAALLVALATLTPRGLPPPAPSAR